MSSHGHAHTHIHTSFFATSSRCTRVSEHFASRACGSEDLFLVRTRSKSASQISASLVKSSPTESVPTSSLRSRPPCEVVTHRVSASIISCDLRLQAYRAPAINHGCCGDQVRLEKGRKKHMLLINTSHMPLINTLSA